MNFLHYLLLTTYFLLLFLRLSRWLAIVQQKEYRLDRMWLFFQSKEGVKEVFNLLPIPRSMPDIKRPVRTVRVLLIALISLKLVLISLFLSSFNIAVFIIIYLFLPLIVILSILPSTLISHLVTYLTLTRARQKILAIKPTIIGITGSYGKTSTKLLLTHVLSQKYSIFTTPKSHNTRYSVAKSILQLFKDQDIAILEYGAYTKGEIKYLAQWFPPTHAVITGITPQHLGLFKSVKNIINAKSELIKALPKGGVVFANLEDTKVSEMVANSSRKVIGYSGSRSTVELTNLKLDEMGKFHFKWQSQVIHTKLVGKHYQATIQAAIQIAQYLDLSEKQIAQGLQTFSPSDNFIQSKINSKGALIIDDGNTSNPKGFEAALDLIKELDKPHKILITSGIVDLGDQSHPIHHQLSQKAKTIVSQVLYTGIAGKAEFQLQSGEKCITNVDEIKKILGKLNKDSLLLIEGRIKKDILEAIS